MTFFVVALMIFIVIVVWIAFTLYDRFLFNSSWKRASFNASAVALVVLGFLLAISEWG